MSRIVQHFVTLRCVWSESPEERVVHQTTEDGEVTSLPGWTDAEALKKWGDEGYDVIKVAAADTHVTYLLSCTEIEK